ncbi:hypothetical protein AAFC00_006029 [Neodothiora populina]|uniref:Uncharacterized protein n=1 Tax=Neodothiora populina TaxID=2781224 RepID=A0ABR3P6P5_9PEZI
MWIRTNASPLLLLLLPAFSAALTPQNPNRLQVLEVESPAPVKHKAVGAAAAAAAAVASSITTPQYGGPTVKPGVGTKDAPVDGLDGKPHAGPFVDTTPQDKGTKNKKPAAGFGELEKPLPTSLEKLKQGGYGSDEAIPEKNDGVMDDPNRSSPKQGTTGTEGGVSERTRKDKSLDAKLAETEKTVEPPKEAPPLPNSEESPVRSKAAQEVETLGDKVVTLTGKPKGAQGLEKPKDLPDKPHDIPAPNPKGLPDTKGSAPPVTAAEENLKPTLPYTEGQKKSTPKTPGQSDETLIQPFHSFVLSFTMIIFSEIGDKTFLVAVVMAMRHSRSLVFSAALSALFAMTVLSALLGHAAPTLLPKELTAFAAAILFLVFGAKLLREGLAMDPNLGVNEEMKEVEGEINEKEHEDRKSGRRKSSVSIYALESGRGRRSGAGDRPKAPISPTSSDDEDSDPRLRRTSAKAGLSNAVGGLTNLLALLLSPAWVNTFIMTFTGEWGDRSQIATIAMAAGQDYWWVIAGAVTGHAICTGLAVIAGSLLAGRIRLRVVTIGGAVAFLVFGVIYLLEAIYD